LKFKMSQVNVYYNYYVPKNPRRACEVLSCMGVMLDDPHITRLIVLAEASEIHEPSGMTYWKVERRPLVADYFAAAAFHSGADDVNVIINSDCFICPSTSAKLKKTPAGEAYCLSRRDMKSLVPYRINWAEERAKRPVRYAMQDAWVFRGPPRPGMWLEFPLGKPGCDSRLAHELQEAGYRISDPFRRIRVCHYHVSEERTWSYEDRVPPPYVNPPKSWDQRVVDKCIGVARKLCGKQ